MFTATSCDMFCGTACLKGLRAVDLALSVQTEQSSCLLNATNEREQATVVCLTVACSQEVCQEEPKEEPVSDIALPNSTSLGVSIAGGKGVVIEQDAQC
jgi:hypothetical protein